MCLKYRVSKVQKHPVNPNDLKIGKPIGTKKRGLDKREQKLYDKCLVNHFFLPTSYVSVDEATNKTRLLLLTFILLSVHYAQPQDRRMGETGKGRMLNT